MVRTLRKHVHYLLPFRSSHPPVRRACCPGKNLLPQLSKLLVAFCIASAVQHVSYGQAHFADCVTRTGNNATIIIPASANIRVNGSPIEIGDELAVVTSAGMCAGTIRWTGKNIAFAIWGQAVVKEPVSGLALNEPLSFQIWDVSENVAFDAENSKMEVSFAADRSYLKPDGKYVPDAIYLVSHLVVSSQRQAAPRPPDPDR